MDLKKKKVEDFAAQKNSFLPRVFFIKDRHEAITRQPQRFPPSATCGRKIASELLLDLARKTRALQKTRIPLWPYGFRDLRIGRVFEKKGTPPQHPILCFIGKQVHLQYVATGVKA